MPTNFDNSSIFIVFPQNRNLNNQMVLIKYNGYTSSTSYDNRDTIIFATKQIRTVKFAALTSEFFNTKNNTVIIPIYYFPYDSVFTTNFIPYTMNNSI